MDGDSKEEKGGVIREIGVGTELRGALERIATDKPGNCRQGQITTLDKSKEYCIILILTLKDQLSRNSLENSLNFFRKALSVFVARLPRRGNFSWIYRI